MSIVIHILKILIVYVIIQAVVYGMFKYTFTGLEVFLLSFVIGLNVGDN